MTSTLHIHLREQGEGPTVLLIHGWMTSGDVFRPLLPSLIEAGFRVLVPDLRGCGESDQGETYALADYVADVANILEEAGPALVVGHSMGGAIAQLLAIEHPDLVRGLVLINPVPASGVPLPPSAKALFAESAGRADLLGTILDMATHTLSEPDRHTLVSLGLTVDPEAMRQSLEAWMQGGFADRLVRIAVPTRVIATDDPFLHPDVLTQTVVDPIASASLHHIPGPGHYPMWESPDVTKDLVQSLLEEVHSA